MAQFEVVSGNFRTVRSTPEEALQCAKSQVFLAQKETTSHLLKLQNAQETQWAYGFNEVNIFVRGPNGS